MEFKAAVQDAKNKNTDVGKVENMAKVPGYLTAENLITNPIIKKLELQWLIHRNQ